MGKQISDWKRDLIKSTRRAVRTIDQIADDLGLPAWDDIREQNFDYIASHGDGIEDEDERAEAEERADTELFATWYDAVLAAASALYEDHGLKLEPVAKNLPECHRSYELKIVPVVSWMDAADHIRDTINGDGFFYTESVRAFLESGPYTARQAVLSHLHWIKKRPEVYGTASAQRIYERSWK